MELSYFEAKKRIRESKAVFIRSDVSRIDVVDGIEEGIEEGVVENRTLPKISIQGLKKEDCIRILTSLRKLKKLQEIYLSKF